MARFVWVAAIMVYLVTLTAIVAPRQPAGLGQRLTAPCPTEDGGPVRPCRWDGRTMGSNPTPNGTVYLIIDEGDGVRVLLAGP